MNMIVFIIYTVQGLDNETETQSEQRFGYMSPAMDIDPVVGGDRSLKVHIEFYRELGSCGFVFIQSRLAPYIPFRQLLASIVTPVGCGLSFLVEC